MRITMTTAAMISAMLTAAATAAPNKGPFAPVEDKPDLPRVLLIGDSISIGYTLAVRSALEGKANVHRIPTNGGPTTRGLEHIDAWLGDGPWDVIHFNWGLHDLKYIGAQGDKIVDKDSEGAHQQVPIEAYVANLDKLIERMKKTGATLVWCTTTPVPQGAQGRVAGAAAKYNAAAAKAVGKHGVTVNDLYGFALPQLEKLQQPKNVHFTAEGSKALGEHVAEVIAEALEEKAKRR